MKATLPLLALAALLGIPANALSCTSRPKTSPPRPIIKVICITPTVYRIYVSGYLTVGGAQRTFCVCGLGVRPSNVITGITAASVIDNSTGKPLVFGGPAGGQVFPFAANIASTAAVQAIMGGGVRASGFLAPVNASANQPVPSRVCVCFCYTIQVNGPTAAVLTALAGARLFGDEGNANGAPRGTHPTLVTAVSAMRSCILYYKFDRRLGALRVNYDGAGIAPPFGTVSTGSAGPASNTAPGLFGAALRGSSNTSATDFNYTNTGWGGGIAGDLTVHWWMKQRNAPGTGLSYIFGGLGSWRCFTNGVAGTGLWMRAWGGPDLMYPGNVQTLAARASGVCIALTVNATTLRAQWYTDGVATGAPIVIPNGMLVAASTVAGGFKIGKHTSNGSSWVYNTDEFKLCNRVASAAEIATWCKAPWAGWGTYGRPWGMWHDCLNGPPRLGNSNYALTLNGPPGGRALLVLDVQEQAEFDMGKFFGLPPCFWYCGFAIQLIAPLDGQGDLIVPAPIPNQASLAGLSLDSQALGVGGPTAGIVISNAGSTRIEVN